MSGFFAANQGTIDNVLLNACLGLSQYVSLRAGIFSVAPVGFAAFGAYGAAIVTLRHGLAFGAGVAVAVCLGAACGAVLGALLARLRGVYQVLATVGFILVVQNALLSAPSITGGVFGMSGIPKLVGTRELAFFLVSAVVILSLLTRGRVGRAFDAIRQDEMAAAVNGICVYRYQLLAFVVSGGLAGMAGALSAYHNYSVFPSMFGFDPAINTFAYAVLGGVETVFGVIVGATVLTMIPELARPLADNRNIVEGALLIIVISYFPRGIVDEIRYRVTLVRRRLEVHDEGAQQRAELIHPASSYGEE